MNIEAKKLHLIERFMKLKQAQPILQVEALISEIEMNMRAEFSEKDIKEGEIQAYDSFTKDVKQWLKNKTSK